MLQSFINAFFSVRVFPSRFLYSFAFYWRRSKRSFWFLKLLIPLLLTPAYYFAWEYIKQLWGTPYFLSLSVLLESCYLAINVFFGVWSFHCTVHESILFTVSGWTFERISGSAATVLSLMLGFKGVVYRDYSLAFFLITIAFWFVFWILAYFLFGYFYKDSTINLERKGLILPIAVIYLIFVCLNSFVMSEFAANLNAIVYIKLYDSACCILLLFLIFYLFQTGRFRLQVETLEQIEKKQREQYEISKDTIDAINTKCHDLKKMLDSSLSGGEIMTKEEIEQLKGKISIYDSFVETGDQTLDLVLNEKSLYCEKNGIYFSVKIRTERLRFLSKMDIYSVFGNIMDNAIEAVRAIVPEKRHIFLSVKEVGSLLVIHEDNPFDGTIVEEGGVIRTKKQDKFVHGYGLLSIERTVKKYGGTMKVSLHDREFNLNIVIPIHTN